MDPQFSLYIYSKYSVNCKKLSTLINESGLDFNLQMVCIDNEQIRQRIKANKQLEIKIVPCILRFFPSGDVEKYEGNYAFGWVESVIEQLKPPQPMLPPPPPQPLQPVPPPQQPRQSTQTKVRIRPEPREEPYSQDQQDSQEEQTIAKKVPSRMKPVQQEATLIDDIPLDDTDRHRSIQPPKRIQQSDGKFLEDDELFGGEPVDYRREPAGAVKGNAQKNISDPHSIQAKAKKMEQEYMETQQEMGNQSRRPLDARVP